jgi:hypothetical protein
MNAPYNSGFASTNPETRAGDSLWIIKVSPAVFGMQGQFMTESLKKASLLPARNLEDNLG